LVRLDVCPHIRASWF